MAMSFQGTGSFDQLAGPYFGGASFYTPPPPPPSEGIFGAYPDYFYRAAGPSQQPHHPSEADRITARSSDTIFGPPLGVHEWDGQSPSGGNGGGNGQ